MSLLFPEMNAVRSQFENMKRRRNERESNVELCEAIRLFIKHHERIRQWEFDEKTPEIKQRIKRATYRQNRRRKSGKFWVGEME